MQRRETQTLHRLLACPISWLRTQMRRWAVPEGVSAEMSPLGQTGDRQRTRAGGMGGGSSTGSGETSGERAGPSVPQGLEAGQAQMASSLQPLRASTWALWLRLASDLWHLIQPP